MVVDFLGFFMLGLMGGFGHCIAMCHPFVIFVSSKFSLNKGYWILLKPQIYYNLGRITTYILLSVVVSFIGDIVNYASSMVGIQKITSFLAGVFLIVYGISMIIGMNIFLKIESRLCFNSSSVINSLDIKSPYLIGIVLGFLPCGLLYGALISAFGLSSTIKSVIAMSLFGLGSAIPLLIFSLVGNVFQKRYKIFGKISAIILIGMGCYFIYIGFRFSL
ncbi:MAG: sulfite exporter TauE/SafE family protein [Calditerrivibrio sp.]|nr:sulfite exporter TauE/SafE family protein [Calditerrivibrio sp.]